MITTKDRLKRLIDELPEAIAGEVFDFAEFLRRKEARPTYEVDLVADPDDTDEDRSGADEVTAMRVAWATYQHGCRSCLEDLRAELEN